MNARVGILGGGLRALKRRPDGGTGVWFLGETIRALVLVSLAGVVIGLLLAFLHS
jgi:hypothetical protein